MVALSAPPPTKRILSVQPVSDGGGSEHALIAMLRQLSEYGWECHVAVPAPPRLAAGYSSAGAQLHVVPMARLTTSGTATRWAAYAAMWPLSVLRLAALARRVGATVIHTNSLHSWYGWAVAVLLRRPHVWHAREIVFQSGAALALERRLARRFATAVIAVSAAVAAQLDPVNVTVITDEADPSVFRPGRAGRFRSQAGIGDGVALVGSLARIDTWKGFDTLLEAVPAIRAVRPDVEVVLAGGTVQGKEWYESQLRGRAAGTRGVRWLGHRDDAADLMADLDVFVQVSSEPEPFGLVVVEALASGVPVVAGAQGGPLEILGPRAATDATSSAGRLVPAGDPDALASAVLSLLPPGPSSTARRRARAALRSRTTGRFAELFDRVTNP
ncbi:MAG: glycosyltransferase family 4 protein [Acidimicrobiales bacterium]